MIYFVLLAPWIAAALAMPTARIAGRASGWLYAAVPALSFFALFHLLGPTGGPAQVHHLTIPWAPSTGLALNFRLDALSIAFGLLITGIGALICLYADAYFRGDPRRGRFMAYLFLFMGAMLGLVFSDNVILLFVFWELTSITSYVLIGFDNQKESSRSAALQALLTTGAGGLALLVGLLLLGNAAGSYNFSDIIAAEGLSSHPHYVAIVLLVLAGAATKSAQFPFHFWLPNAMAAPTPASAYLHSSTMVKGGVYLLARLSPALGDSDLWFWLVVGLGAATMLVGGWLSLQQTALKPMLAYSTVTALGTLVLCIGLGTPVSIAAFTVFLFVHAFYKAALFMVAGTLIHKTHEKNFEKLGGLGRVMPFTMASGLLAALSMAGLPPLLGFVGKESVYEAMLHAPVAMQALVIIAVLSNVANVYVAIAVGIIPFWRRRGEHEAVKRDVPLALWLGPAALGTLGLLSGLYPTMLGQHILDPSGSLVMGAPLDVKLKLWHGVNGALLLSIATLALGLLAVFLRRPWRRVTAPLAALFDRFGPEAAYGGSVAAMVWCAKKQTRLLQHGYLRYYLLVVLVCLIVAVATALPLRVPADSFSPVHVVPHEMLTVALVALAALALTRMRSRFGALACLGVVGYGIAMIYVYYGAPDLAKTQIVVESLAVVFFALLAAAMPGFTELSSHAVRRRDAVVAAIAGSLMGILVYTTLASDQNPTLAEYFRANSLSLAHGRNVVNVILVDFRALDTLAEITVLAVAAFGAGALLRLRNRRERSR